MDSVRIKSLCAFLYTQLFRACGAERRQSSNHGGDLPVAWRFLVKFRDSLDKITSQIPLMKYESPFPLWNSFLKALKSILIGICSRALWKYRLSLQIFFWMKAHFMVSVMENEFVFLHPLQHVSWGLSRAKWGEVVLRKLEGPRGPACSWSCPRLASCAAVSRWTWRSGWLVLGSGLDLAIYLSWGLRNLTRVSSSSADGELMQGCSSNLICVAVWCSAAACGTVLIKFMQWSLSWVPRIF